MNIFIAFIIYISLFSISGYIGYLLLQLGSNNSIKKQLSLPQLFASLVLGISLLIILFALFKSLGTSMYSIILVLVLYYYFFHFIKKSFHINFIIHVPRNTFLITFVLIVFGFLYWLLFTYDFSQNVVRIAFQDHHFYSEVARGLLHTGVENMHNRMFELQIPEKNNLYHYFDSWLVALLAQITRINTFEIQMIIVYPFFYGLTLVGIASFIEILFKKSALIIVLSILISFAVSTLFLKQFQIPILQYWGFGIMPVTYNSMKLLCIYPFVLLSLHFVIRNLWVEFTLTILVSSIIYTTTLIWVTAGVSMVFILCIFFQKQWKGLHLSYSILRIILVFGVSFIIYKLLFVVKTPLNGESLKLITNPKTILLLSAENILRNSICYFPAIIGLLLFVVNTKFKESKQFVFIFFVISGFIISIIFISIFHYSENFSQAVYNFIPHMALCLILIGLIYSTSSYRKVFIAIIAVVGIANMFTIYNSPKYSKQYQTEYLAKVSKIMQNEKVYLVLNEQMPYWFCYDVAQFNSKNNSLSNGCNISIQNHTFTVTKSPLYEWCELHKKQLSYSAIEEYMIEKNIRIIFSRSHESIHDSLKQFCYVYTQDSITKECCLIRKNK